MLENDYKKTQITLMDAFTVEIMLSLIQQVEKYSYCVYIIYFTADVKHSVVRIWEAH